MLIRKNLHSGQFLILIKCTWFGECAIMVCDYLVAALYLKNAVSLYTDKYSNIINKMLYFTLISFTIVVIVYLTIDFSKNIRYFKHNPDPVSAVATYICEKGEWHQFQVRFFKFEYILSLIFDPILMGMLFTSFFLIRRFLFQNKAKLSKIPKDWIMVTHIAIMSIFYTSSLVMLRTAFYLVGLNDQYEGLPIIDSN